MGRRTDRADRYPFALQLSDAFGGRFRNQHMERPIKPAHDGFNRQALNRRNRSGTGNRRVIQLSRQQRRYLYSDSDGDFSDFEFFLVVKSSSFGNIARQLVETDARKPNVHDLSVCVPQESGKNQTHQTGQKNRCS